MKKVIYSCLLLAILFVLNGCGASNDKITINKTKNITKVAINTQPSNNSSLKSTEDKSKITEVINYINDLDLKKTTKDGGQYEGMAYIITVYFDDKTSTEYILLGKFFKESGKYWYEIPYNQAEKFKGIYKSLSSN